MNARPLPVQTTTDKPYGVAGAQVAAQKAVPLAPAPSPGAPAGPTPPGASRVQPGSMGAFDRPTDRPDEHVMTPGPAMPDMSNANLGQLLNQLGQSNPAVAQLAAYVNSGKQ